MKQSTGKTMVKRICAICGKEFESRFARKYCSEECAMEAKRRGARQYWKDTYLRVGKHTFTCVCRWCGEKFEAGSATGKVCKKPECQRMQRLYASKNSVQRKQLIASNKLANKDKKLLAIRGVVREATAQGLSYGEYVARYMR